MPINHVLFTLLERRFERVRIEKAGEPAIVRSGLDPFTLKPKVQRYNGGEEYIVCCPFCPDASGHLYINHQYGQDDATGGNNYHLAHCFRSDCLSDPDNRRQLSELIFSIRPPGARSLPIQPPASSSPSRARRILTKSPAHIAKLSRMDPTFPARAYLTQRGFDIAELEEVWKVGFGCEPSGYPELVGRIYIPVYYEGRLVGCQGRYVGELTDKDTRWAKYYNLPGFQKSQYLYNLDRARQQAVAILVEGVTDVWKLGPAGVALFGKHASTRQIQLISAFLHQKPFVVLLDGEADQEADRLYQQLKPLALAGLAKVQLPPGRDPGSCTRKELWDIIRAQAQTQGVKLPAPS